MARRVFLSYRRSDSPHQAIALKIVLEQKLPDVSVFVDTESVNPAERWPDRLAAALDQSSAVVVLIGPNWRFGADGTDRFADPKDWVLQEVVYALEHKGNAVVPRLLRHHHRDGLPRPAIEPHRHAGHPGTRTEPGCELVA